jgi:hypothetical protein
MGFKPAANFPIQACKTLVVDIPKGLFVAIGEDGSTSPVYDVATLVSPLPRVT